MSRPTDLQFRSPKQRTPEFYSVNIKKTGEVIDPNIQNIKKFACNRSFNTRQRRFYQYDIWARNTSMFLGPGVYQDQEVYKNQVAFPCSSKLKYGDIQREQSRDCYTVIGGSMIQYVPGFDKESQGNNSELIKKINVNDNISKISMNSIFPKRKIALLQNLKNTRASSSQSQYNTTGVVMNSFKQPQQSFYSEKGQPFDAIHRPSTSYSLSRGQRSTNSQSRNNTRNNFSNVNDSFQTPTSQQFIFDSQTTTAAQHLNSQNVSNSNKLQKNNVKNNLIYRTNHRGSKQIDAGSDLPLINQNINGSALSDDNEIDQIQSQLDRKPIKLVNNLIYSSYDQNQARAQTALGSSGRSKSLIQKKFSKISDKQMQELKKSVTLLQAYGEYDRFLQMSKQFLKEKGIVIKKTLRKKNKRGAQIQKQDLKDEQIINPNDSLGENYKEISSILDKKLPNNEETVQQQQ